MASGYRQWDGVYVPSAIIKEIRCLGLSIRLGGLGGNARPPYQYPATSTAAREPAIRSFEFLTSVVSGSYPSGRSPKLELGRDVSCNSCSIAAAAVLDILSSSLSLTRAHSTRDALNSEVELRLAGVSVGC